MRLILVSHRRHHPTDCTKTNQIPPGWASGDRLLASKPREIPIGGRRWYTEGSHLWALLEGTTGHDGEQKPTRLSDMTKIPGRGFQGIVLQSHDRRASAEILVNITSFLACVLGLLVDI